MQISRFGGATVAVGSSGTNVEAPAFAIEQEETGYNMQYVAGDTGRGAGLLISRFTGAHLAFVDGKRSVNVLAHTEG